MGNDQVGEARQKITYPDWCIPLINVCLTTSSFDVREVINDFNDDGILKRLRDFKTGEVFEPPPLVRGSTSDTDSFPEVDSIEIVQKALCLLGLLSVGDAKKDHWGNWGENTTKALEKFQDIAGIKPGTITSDKIPVPGKVFGRESAIKLLAALESLRDGGTWQNAARAAKLPEKKH